MGPWRHNPDIKEKLRAPKPLASASNLMVSIPRIQWKVPVDRAKRRKAKVVCLQPLVLTRSQQAIAGQCYYFVQETIVMCLSINGLHTCRERGREGGRARGSVWVMPSLDLHENFSRVASGCRRSQEVSTPHMLTIVVQWVPSELVAASATTALRPSYNELIFSQG